MRVRRQLSQELALLPWQMDREGSVRRALDAPSRHRVSCPGGWLADSHLTVLTHGRPQPVRVESRHVVLRLLARAGRHDRLAVVVDLEHELRRPRGRVPEDLPEHEGDVAHQVYGVVPDDDDPRRVLLPLVVVGGLLDPDRCLDGARAHCCIVARRPQPGRPSGVVARLAAVTVRLQPFEQRLPEVGLLLLGLHARGGALGRPALRAPTLPLALLELAPRCLHLAAVLRLGGPGRLFLGALRLGGNGVACARRRLALLALVGLSARGAVVRPELLLLDPAPLPLGSRSSSAARRRRSSSARRCASCSRACSLASARAGVTPPPSVLRRRRAAGLPPGAPAGPRRRGVAPPVAAPAPWPPRAGVTPPPSVLRRRRAAGLPPGAPAPWPRRAGVTPPPFVPPRPRAAGLPPDARAPSPLPADAALPPAGAPARPSAPARRRGEPASRPPVVPSPAGGALRRRHAAVAASACRASCSARRCSCSCRASSSAAARRRASSARLASASARRASLRRLALRQRRPASLLGVLARAGLLGLLRRFLGLLRRLRRRASFTLGRTTACRVCCGGRPWRRGRRPVAEREPRRRGAAPRHRRGGARACAARYAGASRPTSAAAP